METFLPKSSLEFGGGSFWGLISPSTTLTKPLISLIETAVSTFYKKILNSGGTARQQNAGIYVKH
jgi:hypothetical protein